MQKGFPAWEYVEGELDHHLIFHGVGIGLHLPALDKLVSQDPI